MPYRLLTLLMLLVVAPVFAAGSTDVRIPYPEGPLTAAEITLQSYYVSNTMLVRNAQTTKGEDGRMTMMVMKVPGKSPKVNLLESWFNTDFSESDKEEKKMLAIFRKGNLRGTGVLMVTHKDTSVSPTMTLWFPAMRKTRKVVAPDQADNWMGTNMTNGDVFMRRLDQEEFELLGEEKLEGCLGALELADADKTKYTKNLPQPSCDHVGKDVYKIKSTAKLEGWYYDYRINYTDKKSFGIYRTVFYKNDTVVKTIEVDWRKLEGESDPRMIYPRYIYTHTPDNDHKSLLYVPRSSIAWNQDIDPKFWSERTLRKIKR